MPDARTCLVLGGREALASLDIPIRQALEGLGLTRAQLPSIEDTAEAIRQADAILAEVSRPSPSIMFELGVARTLGVPTVYLAKDGSRVPPVLEQIVPYSGLESPARLSFLIARTLDDTIAGRPSQSASGITAQAEYAPGRRILAVVVHVARDNGYLLATELGRRPVLLPFSKMIEGGLVDVGERAVREGDLVQVEIAEVDGDRIIARETDAPLPGRIPPDMAGVQSVLRACQMTDSPKGRVLEWASIHPSAVRRLRQIRTRVGHAEEVEMTELDDARTIAEDLFRVANAEALASPGHVAVLSDQIHEVETRLVSLVHRGGAAVSRDRHGLRSLARIAERVGVISPETRDLINALDAVRLAVTHSGSALAQERVENALRLADVAICSLESAWQQLQLCRGFGP